MNIVKGKLPHPVKCVLYGPEGIGKTTFASRWPRPLFLDFEGGTGRLEVDRIVVKSFPELEQVMVGIASDHGDYRTLVFDTADWLDRMVSAAVCDAAGKKGIEDFGYGKGFTYLGEKWSSFLDRLNRFSESSGMHVLFLAHAMLRKFEQPDEAGAYDRWELKCCKTVSPLLKEWADALLFANYKTIVTANDGGKAKAVGGKRVVYTSHHPCWDAKNRFNLPPELSLEPDKLAPELAAAIRENMTVAPPTAPAKPEAETERKPEPPAATPPPAPPSPPAPPAPAADPEKEEALRKLNTLMEMGGIHPSELAAEVARKGVCPADTPIEQYNVATLKRIVSGWDTIKNNIMQHKEK